jgi:hypothetical protein
MNEIFVEQIVKKQSSLKTLLIKSLISVIAFILISLSFLILNMLFTGLGFIVSVMILWGAYILFTNQNIEFEYTLVTGEFEIDKIYHKSRRKSIFKVDVKQLKIMAPALIKEYQNEFKEYQKLYDCTGNGVTENTYVALFIADKEIIKVLFDPNEDLIKGIKSYGPRKVYDKK